MLSLRNIKLAKKLWLIIGSALAGIVLLISMALIFLNHDLVREKEHDSRRLVEAAHSIVNSYYMMAMEGKISEQEAKTMAIAAVKAMGYNGIEYLWINDMQPRIIMHPIRTELDGRDVSDMKDSSGKKLFVEFVNIVKKEKEGFVYYSWPKPGFTDPVPKVSFVKGFAPWGWIVGSGVYLNDVSTMFWSKAGQYATAGTVILLLIFVTSSIVAKNITRTEESLSISEEKFFKAFHTSPASIAIARKCDGLFLEANEAFFEMLGYEQHEIVGHSSLALGLWVDVSERSRVMAQIERDKRVRNIEISFRKKSGEVLTLLWSSDLLLLNEEEYVIAILRDITTQKEQQRQLLKSKAELTVKHEQLSALFQQVDTAKKEWERTMDCINDMVILLDRQGKIRRCNRATMEFAQKPHAQIIGLDFQHLIHIEGFSPADFTARSGETYYEKLQRWFLFSCYPYFEKDQEDVSGAVITIHDMTDIKRSAIELHKAYTDLKEAQAQMLQQEKMASIGVLAAGVAHEINNPTGFIMSNLGTFRKYIDRIISFIQAQTETGPLTAPDEQEKLSILRKQLKIDHILADLPSLIGETMDGAERIKKIAQELKSFSRADDAQAKVVNIIECIESTINIVWNELKYKATLKKEFQALPPIKCHPQQLNQVFLNLLVNAAHAIEGQGEITVRTWRENGSACISISDTGCGMSDEVRSHIFEPFFTTKESGKGTGLGLSISYDIIKKHGGDITVDSVVGKGTAFTIKLPLVDMAAGEVEHEVVMGSALAD